MMVSSTTNPYKIKAPKHYCLGVCLYSDKFKYIKGGHKY